MKKKHAFGIIIALCIVGASALFLWLRNGGSDNAQQQERGGQPAMVNTTSARNGTVIRTIDLTGEIVATNNAVITSTKEGPIDFFPWREGDSVGQGEKLVGIEREVHQAELRSSRASFRKAQAVLEDMLAGARPEAVKKAEAEVERWESTLKEAKAAYERRINLLAGDFISREKVEEARGRMDVAAAQLAAAKEELKMLKSGPTATELEVQRAVVKEAEAKLELAEAHLAECVINAPFSGVVTAAHVRKGELAVPRTPLLKIADMDSLVIRFAVPESFAGSVECGTELSVSLDAFPDKDLRARLTRIYPELNSRMRTRTVEAKLLEKELAPAPGMFARIKLEIQKAENVILVPDGAIIRRNGDNAVFVLEEGKASMRPVSLCLSDGHNTQIEDGIEAGDQIITKTSRQIRDGAPVRIQAPAGKPEQGRRPQQ